MCWLITTPEKCKLVPRGILLQYLYGVPTVVFAYLGPFLLKYRRAWWFSGVMLLLPKTHLFVLEQRPGFRGIGLMLAILYLKLTQLFQIRRNIKYLYISYCNYLGFNCVMLVLMFSQPRINVIG